MARRPLRLLGNAAFLIGSVSFLFEELWRAGVFAFVVGSAALLLAEALPSPTRRRSRRELYRQQRDDDERGR